MDGIDLSSDCVGDNLRVCFFSHVLSSLQGALACEVLRARESEICKLYFTSEKARVNSLARIKMRFIKLFVLVLRIFDCVAAIKFLDIREHKAQRRNKRRRRFIRVIQLKSELNC